MDEQDVNAKIKSAMKAKLVELGAYVDDELPEYIMVMVANKKTPRQMEQDLEIFLHQHTLIFTKWLFGVLEKLKKVSKVKKSKDKTEKKEAQKKTKKSAEGKVSKKSAAGADGEGKKKLSPGVKSETKKKEKVKKQKVKEKKQPPALDLENATIDEPPANEEPPSPTPELASPVKAKPDAKVKESKPVDVPAESKSEAKSKKTKLASKVLTKRKSSSPAAKSKVDRKEDEKKVSKKREDVIKRKTSPLEGLRSPSGFRSRSPPYQRKPRFSPHGRGFYQRPGPRPRSRSPLGPSSRPYQRTRKYSLGDDRPRGRYDPARRSRSPIRIHDNHRRSDEWFDHRRHSEERFDQRRHSADRFKDRGSPPNHQRYNNRDNSEGRKMMRRQKRDSEELEDESPRSDRESTNQQPAIMSSVGAVVNHDSEDEYNPMKMLKKSMASTIKVPSRPIPRSPKKKTTSKKSSILAPSKSLVLRAVQEADNSIKKSKAEERERNAMLDELRKRKVEKIAQIRERTRNKSGDGNIEKRSIRRLSSERDEDIDNEVIDSPRKNFIIKIKNRAATKKKEDLRVQLDKRRITRDPSVEELNDEEPVILKRTLKNENFEERVQPQQTTIILLENDQALVEMRRRALESMARGRTQGQIQKVIVPLNDHSSSESSSSDDDSSSSSDDDDSSDSDSSDSVSLSSSENKSKKNEPTFVVTLDGIDASYFKNKKSTSQTGNKLNLLKARYKEDPSSQQDRGIDEPIVVEQRKTISVPVLKAVGGGSGGQDPKNMEAVYQTTKKPEAKVAPLQPAIKVEKQDEVSKPESSISKKKESSKPQPRIDTTKFEVAKREGHRSDQVATSNTESSIKVVSTKRDLSKVDATKKDSNKVVTPLKRSLTRTVPAKLEPQKVEGQTSNNAEAAKSKRARIEPPPKDPPVPKSVPQKLVIISNHERKAKALSPVAISRTVCRFWPKCTRGSQCFFYHPTTPKAVTPPSLLTDKYRWSSSHSLT